MLRLQGTVFQIFGVFLGCPLAGVAYMLVEYVTALAGAQCNKWIEDACQLRRGMWSNYSSTSNASVVSRDFGGASKVVARLL